MDKQVYGVILAGGQGTRMGNSDKPKQFLEVGGRPILIHTVEKFAVNPDFQQIIVLAPKQWLAYTKDIIKKYIRNHERIVIIEGGNTRNETIMNAVQYIEDAGCLTEDTIIVTHVVPITKATVTCGVDDSKLTPCLDKIATKIPQITAIQPAGVFIALIKSLN